MSNLGLDDLPAEAAAAIRQAVDTPTKTETSLDDLEAALSAVAELSHLSPSLHRHHGYEIRTGLTT